MVAGVNLQGMKQIKQIRIHGVALTRAEIPQKVVYFS